MKKKTKKKSMRWSRFFLGTPRRFAVTATVVGGVIVSVQPGLLQTALHRLVVELQPLYAPVIAFGLLYVAFKILLRKVF